MVDKHSQTSHRDNQELHSETVMIAVVGGPELHVDQIDGGICTADVDHLGEQHTPVYIHRSHTGITGATKEGLSNWYLTFMQVLYSEMNEVSRSRYRVVNTRANRIWLFPEIPLGGQNNIQV